MLKTDTLRNLGVALLVGVLSLSTVNPAAAIGVVGHGTYFGRYNNPLHGGAVASVAPAYVAPAYAAPAPVYAAPVVAPAPVYAPQAVSCVPA
ncbi:MAG: hypothetical protein KDA42_14785, partial [Planctomycetales bacterium]|nr:hypothetical protein [Planctomycetales bacterium]